MCRFAMMTRMCVVRITDIGVHIPDAHLITRRHSASEYDTRHADDVVAPLGDRGARGCSSTHCECQRSVTSITLSTMNVVVCTECDVTCVYDAVSADGCAVIANALESNTSICAVESRDAYRHTH